MKIAYRSKDMQGFSLPTPNTVNQTDVQSERNRFDLFIKWAIESKNAISISFVSRGSASALVQIHTQTQTHLNKTANANARPLSWLLAKMRSTWKWDALLPTSKLAKRNVMRIANSSHSVLRFVHRLDIYRLRWNSLANHSFCALHCIARQTVYARQACTDLVSSAFAEIIARNVQCALCCYTAVLLYTARPVQRTRQSTILINHFS